MALNGPLQGDACEFKVRTVTVIVSFSLIEFSVSDIDAGVLDKTRLRVFPVKYDGGTRKPRAQKHPVLNNLHMAIPSYLSISLRTIIYI